MKLLVVAWVLLPLLLVVLALALPRTAVHVDLIKDLIGEFDDIRNDPERAALQMYQMQRTYQNYLDQGNNPVEYFIDRPGENIWAAGHRNGEDIVIYDSTAPHPAVMAHGAWSRPDESQQRSSFVTSAIGARTSFRKPSSPNRSCIWLHPVTRKGDLSTAHLGQLLAVP